ncbi:MAG TPA: shikimate kinase AroK [Chromatiales bacterium]|nr:shikimate kinase AroK [Chromatiales bacterium]
MKTRHLPGNSARLGRRRTALTLCDVQIQVKEAGSAPASFCVYGAGTIAISTKSGAVILDASQQNGRNLFLVGPMGSGKSAIGRRLARKLGREFVDSDEVIEQRTGVDIAYIFEKEGEAGFRKRERAVIHEFVSRSGIVLATGGGTVLDAANRKALTSHGTVVYLHTSVTQQLRRTRGNKRPLLNRGNRRQVLEELMQVREPLYREIADLVVETDGRTVASVVREIRDWLQEQP